MTTTVGNYLIFDHHVVGRGISAEVKLAKDMRNGQKCAVKIMQKSKLTRTGAQNLLNELKALRMLHSPHIVGLLDIVEEKNVIYVFMEYLPNGTLYNFISKRGRISEDEARLLTQQMLAALEECHLHNVFHRDLKLENMLFDASNNLKLIDFGLCAITDFSDSLLNQYCGTHVYASPQIHANQPYHGAGTDVWSMGIVLYILLCGYMPFYSENNNNMKELSHRVRFEPALPMAAGISNQAFDLVSKLLCKDPCDRITLAEIKQHPWMTKNADINHVSCMPPTQTISTAAAQTVK